jgi:hypothetical protein
VNSFALSFAKNSICGSAAKTKRLLNRIKRTEIFMGW